MLGFPDCVWEGGMGAPSPHPTFFFFKFPHQNLPKTINNNLKSSSGVVIINVGHYVHCNMQLNL